MARIQLHVSELISPKQFLTINRRSESIESCFWFPWIEYIQMLPWQIERWYWSTNCHEVSCSCFKYPM